MKSKKELKLELAAAYLELALNLAALAFFAILLAVSLSS